ncbi:hypothetical protein LCL95_10135 [Bacillus timonensis]|nr:hypothetical protein [Bacillus timonensis]
MLKKLTALSFVLVLLLAMLPHNVSKAAALFTAKVTISGQEYIISSDSTNFTFDVDKFVTENNISETDKLEKIAVTVPTGVTSVDFDFEGLEILLPTATVDVTNNTAEYVVSDVLGDLDRGSDGVAITNLRQVLYPIGNSVTAYFTLNMADETKQAVAFTIVSNYQPAVAGTVKVNSVKFVTNKGVLEATSKNNQFVFNLDSLSNDAIISEILLSSNTAVTGSIFSVESALYRESLDVQFVNGVASINMQKLVNRFPEFSDFPQEFFTIGMVKMVLDMSGKYSFNGFVADAAGNESTFTVTYKSEYAAGWSFENGNWYFYKDNKGTKATGWMKWNNKWYFLDATGAMQTGWEKVNSKWYFFAESGEMQTGLVTVDGKVYFLDTVNGDMKTGWVTVSNVKRYFNPATGVMATGWTEIAGKKYFLEANGAVTVGWKQLDGSWYFFNAEGDMKTGWTLYKNSYFFLAADGKMATGLKEIGGKKYFFNTSGVMTTGWVTVDGKSYFFNANGDMRTGWLSDKNSWYFLNVDGTKATGMKVISGKKYYFNNNGQMTTGWVQDNSKWFYFNNTGEMTTGWFQFKNNWYHLTADGMSTGWVKSGSKWYFMNENGTLRTGWLLYNNEWYYLMSGGEMRVGWTEIGGKWYYFYGSGKMAYSTTIGKWKLGASGALIN